jgi:hypothetical protein
MTHVFGNIQLNDDLKVYEYRLMYFFGCWITAQKIYAENDAEALYDINQDLVSPTFRFALWCGNRKVKDITEPTWNDGYVATI